MGRINKVYYHTGSKRWAYGGGDVSEKTGRRKTVYLSPEIPDTPDGRRKATKLMEAHLAERPTEIVGGPQLTVRELANLYGVWSKTSIKLSTYETNMSYFRMILDHPTGAGRTFGGLSSEEITATVAHELVLALVGRNYKATTIRAIMSLVKACLNWAAAPIAGRTPERIIPVNPLDKFSSPHTRVPSFPDRYAGRDEVEAFVAWVHKQADAMPPLMGRFEHRYADLVWTLYLTGARPLELCTAEWGDFNPQAQQFGNDWWGSIVLDWTRHKTGKKKRNNRVILLAPELVSMIEAYRTTDHHPRWIWTHRRGAGSLERFEDSDKIWGDPWARPALSSKTKNLRRLAMADGVPVKDVGDQRFNLYRLRHSRAAELLEATNDDVYLVATFLGTSVAMIEKTYGSIGRERLVSAGSKSLIKPTGEKPSS